MCKNTRISGLKSGLIASQLNMSTSSTLYSEMPWVIFCCRDDKDVEILPGNILSEGKKNAHLLRNCSTVLEPQQVLTVLYREEAKLFMLCATKQGRIRDFL